jgi:hypothetical protein
MVCKAIEVNGHWDSGGFNDLNGVFWLVECKQELFYPEVRIIILPVRSS